MITRSNLVEQLRDYQIRSQHKWAALSFFSPKPLIITRTDVVTALLWAVLFVVLIVSSCISLFFRYWWLGFGIIFLGILVPICLKISRKIKLAKKRQRRMLLPLSM